MGIGSTILAATHFMKRAIGIEISQKYIEIAKERLKGVQTTFGSLIK